MGSITAEVTPDLFPVLFQHQHSFAVTIAGEMVHFQTIPAPLLNPLCYFL